MKKIYQIIQKVLLLSCILMTQVACVDELKVGDGFLDKAKGEDVNEDLIFSIYGIPALAVL